MVGEPEGHAAERTRRIELRVDREVARRRRLLRVYLLLMVVPLAVAAVFMIYGRSDRQVVQQEVEQRVKPVEDSYQKIQPMLTEVSQVGELLPRIQAVDTRFQSYERGQDTLRQQVAQVKAQVGDLEPAVEEARQAKAQIVELQRRYESQQKELRSEFEALSRKIAPSAEERSRGGQPSTGERPPSSAVDQLAGRTSKIERQQAELSRQFTRLMAAPPPSRAPADLDALNQRLGTLESSIGSLQKEVRELRAQINRLQRTRPSQPPY